MSLALELPADETSLDRAARLAVAWEGLAPQEILRRAIEQEFIGRIAMVSSFGAESASLLHMVAAIDPALPVLFIDTDKHFAQTLDYKDELAARLGLKDLRVETPDPAEAKAEDPKGDLWKRDPDACCALRKVRTNERALAGFDAWISGRKRHHGAARAHLPVVEHDGLHFKVNPLVSWTPADIKAYVKAHDLPAHPLVADGYPSIGCWPCTSPAQGDDARSGRWANQDKTECGIHRPAPNKPQRAF
jgi:phosphoadenosine phosphosulfate reductase